MNRNQVILINGRFLSQQMTGVHRYAYEICCALHQQGVPIKRNNTNAHLRSSRLEEKDHIGGNKSPSLVMSKNIMEANDCFP